jgi:hypothetical protein
MAVSRIELACACLLAAASLAACSAVGGDEEPPADVRGSPGIPAGQRDVERALEQAVLSALGEGVAVRCWTVAEWDVRAAAAARANGLPGPNAVLGIAENGLLRAIHLSPRVCTALAHYLAAGKLPPAGEPAFELAQALVTVGHETGHLVSDLDTEATAECFGAQHVALVAQALGATAAEGRLLADLYWGWVYPRTDPLYRSPECHDGGGLDLNPFSPVWP